MKLLHLDSSALGTGSVTRELTAAIVARWQDKLPQLQVEYRDLYSMSRKILCKSAAENSAAAGYDRNAAVKIFVYHGYLPSLSDFETASQSPFIYAAPSARS